MEKQMIILYFNNKEELEKVEDFLKRFYLDFNVNESNLKLMIMSNIDRLYIIWDSKDKDILTVQVDKYHELYVDFNTIDYMEVL